MSNTSSSPLISAVRTYPLKSAQQGRRGQFSRRIRRERRIEFLNRLPDVLGVRNLRDLACAILKAGTTGKPFYGASEGMSLKPAFPHPHRFDGSGLRVGNRMNGSGIIHDLKSPSSIHQRRCGYAAAGRNLRDGRRNGHGINRLSVKAPPKRSASEIYG